MRFLILIFVLFLGCDDNPSEPSGCDIQFENVVWVLESTVETYSDECDCSLIGLDTCPNETEFYDLCSNLIINANTIISDWCSCEYASQNCYTTEPHDGYTCDENIITPNEKGFNFFIENNKLIFTHYFMQSPWCGGGSGIECFMSNYPEEVPDDECIISQVSTYIISE